MGTPPAPTGASSPAGESNRWAVLALIGVAQLMVVLDATIVNIALPSAQTDLGFSPENRQWVVTAYALAFGSLLLIGGRLGDLFGRKWTFVGGLIGFSIASFIGGLAPSFGVLVAARALQGVFGALLAPAALGLLTVTFADSPDRPKAFGIFAAVATAGASVGLILGGVLTDALSWRWCLYVNLVIAIPAAVVALRLISAERPSHRPRIDWIGTALACLGLFCLVFGFSEAERKSWDATSTIAFLVAAVVILTAFVLTQRRVKGPLLPLHIVLHRARGGAYLSIVVAASGMFAVFLFLTYFMQKNLEFSPLKTGIAFLPMTAAIFIMAPTIQTKILPRLGVRPIVMTGMTLGFLSMLFFTQLDPSSTYAGDVLPGLVLLGIGMPCVFAPSFATATLGVDRQDAGVASAMVNTSQQVGGAVGTAILSTVFTQASDSYLESHARTATVAGDAAIHGYTVAFTFATVLFAIGFVIAAVVLPRRITPQQQPVQQTPAAEGAA
ncbi:MFS transporter [Patulibacter minatonensis]|uniref:MFS transporter n=1 Tax=Patulibacter minatonensis TaxID=298163 RepID=UPI00055CDC7D|nr:MFS transporter [Patulibacter minatonensis]